MDVQKLQGLQHPGGLAHTRHAAARKQRVVQGVGSGQRAGVAHGGLRAQRRRAGLQCDQRHALRQGLQGHGAERGHVIQAFNVQADGADARVCEQRLHDSLHAVTGLVAHGDQVGQRQPAPLHGQVQADVAALRHDGHAALHPLPAVLVRPQRHAVQVVQHAVAVGPDQRHVPGGCH